MKETEKRLKEALDLIAYRALESGTCPLCGSNGSGQPNRSEDGFRFHVPNCPLRQLVDVAEGTNP